VPIARVSAAAVAAPVGGDLTRAGRAPAVRFSRGLQNRPKGRFRGSFFAWGMPRQPYPRCRRGAGRGSASGTCRDLSSPAEPCRILPTLARDLLTLDVADVPGVPSGWRRREGAGGHSAHSVRCAAWNGAVFAYGLRLRREQVCRGSAAGTPSGHAGARAAGSAAVLAARSLGNSHSAGERSIR